MSPDIPSSAPGSMTRDDDLRKSIHIPDWLPSWLRRPGPLRNVLPYASILVWYVFNMSVVLSNRWIFTELPLPTSLTLLHSFTGLTVSTILLATRSKWSALLGIGGVDEMSREEAPSAPEPL